MLIALCALTIASLLALHVHAGSCLDKSSCFPLLSFRVSFLFSPARVLRLLQRRQPARQDALPLYTSLTLLADVCSVTASSLAEERLTDHLVLLNDIDIDLPSDRPLGYVEQLTALYFDGLEIDWGATISQATIQFTSSAADDKLLLSSTVKASMTITGEYGAYAPMFSSSFADVSQRPKTVSFATWAPPRWNASNLAGAAQRTVDFSSVIQEIVTHPSWISGNSVVIMFQRSSDVDLSEADRRQAVFGSSNKNPVMTVTFTSTYACRCS